MTRVWWRADSAHRAGRVGAGRGLPHPGTGTVSSGQRSGPGLPAAARPGPGPPSGPDAHRPAQSQSPTFGSATTTTTTTTTSTLSILPVVSSKTGQPAQERRPGAGGGRRLFRRTRVGGRLQSLDGRRPPRRQPLPRPKTGRSTCSIRSTFRYCSFLFKQPYAPYWPYSYWPVDLLLSHVILEPRIDPSTWLLVSSVGSTFRFWILFTRSHAPYWPVELLLSRVTLIWSWTCQNRTIYRSWSLDNVVFWQLCCPQHFVLGPFLRNFMFLTRYQPEPNLT